jgi:Short C-terminal domain/Phospholipase_D-nuclease N-terminal
MPSPDYPLLGLVYTMFIFSLFAGWFVLLFKIIADVFRRQDIGGGAKVLWLIFVIVFPFLGVFVYLISQNQEMVERDAGGAKAAQPQFDDRLSTAAPTNGGPATEIDKAKQLLDDGVITAAEFEAIKAKALA